jgi:Tfp pilus assembly protein PilF
MRFEERARNAYERGDKIRALVLLVEGVKRHPGYGPGLAFLVSIYGDEIIHPGLEADVVRALAAQPNPETILADIAYRFEQRGEQGLLRALTLAAQERKLAVDIRRAPQWSEAASNSASVSSIEAFEDRDPEADVEGGPSSAIHLETSFDKVNETPHHGVRSPARGPDDDVRQGLASKDMGAEEDRQTRKERSSGRGARRRTPLIRLRYVLLALIVCVIGSTVGYQLWLQAHRTARVSRLDAALRMMDPLDEGFVSTHFDGRQWPPGEERAPFDERAFFARTLIALELGKDEGLEKLEASSPWGWGGQFHVALIEDDLEAAIVAATRIDLMAPDGLVGIWVRGRLCEARSDWGCADESYRRLSERFPDFVPAYVARMRMATLNYRPDQWEDARQKLQRRKSGHAYGRLSFPDPFMVLEGQDSGFVLDLSEVHEPTIQAAGLVIEAARSLAQWRWDEARAHLEESRSLAPETAVTEVLTGVLEAALGQAERAHETFSRACEPTFGLSEEAVGHLRYLAPLSLTYGGRPDLALVFTSPHRMEQNQGLATSSGAMREFFERAHELRPPVLTAPATSPEARRRERLSYATALGALGAGDLARLVLEDDGEPVEGWEADAERLFGAITSGSNRAAHAGVSRHRDEVASSVATVYLAYLEGRYDDAIESASKLDDESVLKDPRLVRPLALSYLGASRGREALALLEDARGHPFLASEWETLRLRIDVRTGQRDDDARARLAALEAARPTSINRIVDLATAALWLRQMDRARAHAEAALSRAPEHPEVHWILGLIERLEGNENAYRRHFRKAWRGDENEPARLVELGFIHLEFGRHAMAQELFYGALMRDRNNTEALRGMGLAYLGFDEARGQRDMARLLHNYGSRPHLAAQRGEIFKALALLNGAREGEEAARSYLEKAQAELGARADVLVELGRYHHARGEAALARQAYVSALQKHSTFADAHLGLARVALDEGESRLARDHFERFIALQVSGPEVDAARLRLSELRARELLAPGTEP